MDNEELQAIKQRVDAATPGPWTAKARASDGYVDSFLGVEVEGPPDAQRGQFSRMEDADFIAHARDDVPALVAEVEQLRAEVDQLQSKLAYKDLDFRIIFAAEAMYRQAWDAIPTGALFDYWDGSQPITPDAKYVAAEVGDWIETLKLIVELGLDPVMNSTGRKPSLL